LARAAGITASIDVVIIADSRDDRGDAGDAEHPRAPGAETIAMELDAGSTHDRLVRVAAPEGGAGAGDRPPLVPGRPAGAGKFAIIEELNRGGMGVVLRGRDRGLHREVAIKVIRDQDSPHQRDRFLKEAQITGQLEHPNIVPVHEFGVDASGRMFFAMKLVRGRNLAEVIDQHRTQPAIAAQEYPLVKMVGILVQVCNAIAFAHSRGVTHRDLKPGNIMLGDFGEVMLMDWGLAKVGEAAAAGTRSDLGSPRLSAEPEDESTCATVGRFDITVDGAVIGTPAYMSPEQASGQISKMDNRSDVYALGAILYEIITLHPPISGSDLKDVLRKAMLGHIEPPERRAPARQVPRDLAAIAMKALAADPQQRYPGASLMRRDLENFLEGRAVSARADSLVEALAKVVRRHRITSTAVALAALLLAAVVVASYVFNLQQRQRAEAERSVALIERSRAETESDKAKRERNRAEAAAEAAERERQRATSESRAAQLERGRAEQALQVADQQRAIAEEERQRSTSAFEREQRQREQSDVQNHLASLALAGEQIGHHEFAAARASLEGCPARYRDWVWRRLSLLCRQQLALFADHGDAVAALACTPDGARMVSIGSDGVAMVYDLPARRRIAVGALSGTGIAAVAISADGARVLGAGRDGALRLWRVGEAEHGPLLVGHDGAATCVLFAGGGQDTAYSGGIDGTVRAWDLASGRQRRLVGRLSEPVRSLALLGDGERVIAGGASGEVRCWDAADGRLAASTRVAGPVLAIDGRGPTLLYTTARNAAVVWDLAGNVPLATCDGHERELSCAAFSGDGRHIATGSLDGTARVWDLTSGACTVALCGHGGTVDGLVFTTGDGQLLTASDDGTVRLWDARRRRDIDELALPAGLAALSLSPDGLSFIAGGADGTAVLWDLAHARATATLVHGPEILATAFSRDGALAATAGAGGACRVWDARSGVRRALVSAPPAAIHQLVFSAAGEALLTAGDEGVVRVWSTQDGSELFSCAGHAGAVLALALSPDGRTVASAGSDGTIRTFRARSGEALAVIPVHDATIVALAFSPDGQHLLSASERIAEIWDAASGEKTQSLRGHTGSIMRVAYGADGSQAMTASSDGTARIWDVASGRTLMVLREHRQPIIAIQPVPGDRALVTADRSGRVILWSADEP
jgi:WD40 repeat protein/serine/threonine protein kinase